MRSAPRLTLGLTTRTSTTSPTTTGNATTIWSAVCHPQTPPFRSAAVANLVYFSGSENFTAHAHSVQDGSHPSPPINPVMVAIKELQDEVDDVIACFNARLRKIKRSGARGFGSPVPADEDSEEEADASIPAAEDSEQTEASGEGSVRNVVVGRGKGAAESASILPADEPEQTETPEGWVRNVVVGRGKGEVEAALNRVAEADAQKTSLEHAVDADAVAQSLSEELASEETSEPVAPVHQEL